LAERRLVLPEGAVMVEQSDSEGEPDPFELTLSVGIASRQLGDGEDARALLRRAHKALWEAKQNGGGGWAVSRIPRAG
jgi:PleD family two-component response regulator